MNNIIKYKAFLELIDNYELERETKEMEKNNNKSKGEIEYLREYAFIDVTKNGIGFERSIPITRIEGTKILQLYEDYFDKKHTYIIIDNNGKHGAFICSILKRFGYKCVYLNKGFKGFHSWYQKNKKIEYTNYDDVNN